MATQHVSFAELETHKSWEEARRIASVIGPVPSSFSTCIRFLRADSEQSAGAQLSRNSRCCLNRLFNSPSFKAPFYYAALSYRRDKLPPTGYISNMDIINCFHADELAFMMALLYLFRRIRKGCDQTMWQEYIKNCHLLTDLGAFLGQAIPTIGLARGMLLGGIRHLAAALFLGIDHKNFSHYWKALNRADRSFDLEREHAVWGCSHPQVASILVQNMGLGVDLGSALVRGLMPSDAPSASVPREAAVFKVGAVWLEALVRSGLPPDIPHRVEFYPKLQDLETLKQQVQHVRKNVGVHKWLSKRKDDISPEISPQLFRESGKSPAATTDSDGAEAEEAAFNISEAELRELEEDA